LSRFNRCTLLYFFVVFFMGVVPMFLPRAPSFVEPALLMVYTINISHNIKYSELIDVAHSSGFCFPILVFIPNPPLNTSTHRKGPIEASPGT